MTLLHHQLVEQLNTLLNLSADRDEVRFKHYDDLEYSHERTTVLIRQLRAEIREREASAS